MKNEFEDKVTDIEKVEQTKRVISLVSADGEILRANQRKNK